MNDVVVVNILGCVLGDIVGCGACLYRIGVLVHIDVSLQVHVLVAYNLSHRGGNDVEDIAVASEFLTLQICRSKPVFRGKIRKKILSSE